MHRSEMFVGLFLLQVVAISQYIFTGNGLWHFMLWNFAGFFYLQVADNTISGLWEHFVIGSFSCIMQL